MTELPVPLNPTVGNSSRVPSPTSCTEAPVRRMSSIEVVEFFPVQPFIPRTVSTTATISSPSTQFHWAPMSLAKSAGFVPSAGVYESVPVRGAYPTWFVE